MKEKLYSKRFIANESFSLPDPSRIVSDRYIMPVVKESLIKYVEFIKVKTGTEILWKFNRGPSELEVLL